MGESFNAVMDNLQNAVNFDDLAAKAGGLQNLINVEDLMAKISGLPNLLPAPIKELYNTHTAVFILVAACLLCLVAFEGYKLFKMALYVGSAAIFGTVGFWYVAPMLPENVRTMVPEIVNFDVLVAVVCALIAVFICKCAYTLMIMILGGAVGYLVGANLVYAVLLEKFSTLGFLQMEQVKHIVGGAIGAVAVLVFVLIFKHVFIIGSSFLGTISAALLVQKILMPVATDEIKICFIILAVALGIFAVVRQYQEEEKATEIIF